MKNNQKIEKPDLKIGFIPIICSTPLIYAHSHGIFEKNGLNVELTKPSGWSGIKELLVYDYIDAAHMLSPLPLACALGIDGKKAELRVASIQNINGQAFILSIKHLSIRNVREMEGFTLGVPYKFSMHYYLLCYYLAANGLNPLKDVIIKEVVPPLMPYYLRKGILDGFFCADPFNQIPVHQKTGFIYILSKDIWYGHPCCSVATSQKFIDKYPNTYKVLLHSILEAEYKLHYATVEERKEIAKEISAPYYIDQEDYIPVAQSLSGEFPDGKGGNFFIPDRIDFIPYPWPEYGKWMLSQMQRWSQLPGKVNYDDIVESVFETEENIELAKSLGFKVPYKPNLGGIKPFTGKDPFNYMIKQPFCAFVEESKTLRQRTSIESYNTYFTDFNRHMAYVAGGNLDEQMEITDSGEVGQSQQLFNELTLNMRFMKNKLQESNEMLEQRVNERTEDLKESYHKIDFYKDLLAHDLGNILQNIQSSVQLMDILKDDPKNSDKMTELNKIIKRQLERGSSLITNVRKLSEIEEREITLKSIDVKKIIETAIEHAQVRFNNKSLEIKWEMPIETYNAKGGDLLLDAFENIFLNGVLHNESNKILLWVNLAKIQENGKSFIKIEFKDNGIGIIDERKKEIFKRSYKKDRSTGGMGIGLSLVKKIINDYNGWVGIENRVMGDHTKGSNFIILLEEAE